MRVLIAEASDYRGPITVGSHALAREFLRMGARVCWFGPPLDARSIVSGANDPRVRRRLRAWRSDGHQDADDVFEYYPFTLLPVIDSPFLRSRFVGENTLRATLPRADSILRERGFASPDLVWLPNSRFAHAAWKLARARRSACRLSDDWAHFGRLPASLHRLHDEVVDGADAVFVTSRRTAHALRGRRPDAVYLPNGVSEAFFEGAPSEPSVLARFPRPRVVFVGALDAWIDFDTIAAVGERIPCASVLVFGPGEPKVRAYPANLHFLGAYPYRDLPTLLRHCDVGLVPFVKSELTHAVSPLKLFEYLAAGLPTVATRLHEIEASESPATLCDDLPSFVRAVESVLDGDPGGRADRVAFAREHTWTKRFEAVRATLGF
ncbi:MAG TPA: glycosyltransferase [Candidatus Krumholzibacteria bacterium]|nr:glycosyltransferase [Candidatus Krumholzibacteria bacterium]